MYHAVDGVLLEQRLEPLRIEDVALLDPQVIRPGLERALGAARKLPAVEQDHVIPVREERLHDVQPDESGTAGDECRHRSSFWRTALAVRSFERTSPGSIKWLPKSIHSVPIPAEDMNP